MANARKAKPATVADFTRGSWGGARPGARRPRKLTREQQEAVLADYVGLRDLGVGREQSKREVAERHQVTVSQVMTCIRGGVRRRRAATKQFLKSPVAKKNLKILRKEKQAIQRVIRRYRTQT